MPQLVVLICLLRSGIVSDNNVGHGLGYFDAKFLISLFSSSWAMAKFLQIGPIQLVPQDKIGIGILIVTIANFFGLFWKGFVIVYMVDYQIYTEKPSLGQTQHFFQLLLLQCCLIILPAILLVNKIDKHSSKIHMF